MGDWISRVWIDLAGFVRVGCLCSLLLYLLAKLAQQMKWLAHCITAIRLLFWPESENEWDRLQRENEARLREP